MKFFSFLYQNEYLPSCYRSHWKYSMCHYHYAEGHRGKWTTCKQCVEEQGADEVTESKQEWYNFNVKRAKREIVYYNPNKTVQSNKLKTW